MNPCEKNPALPPLAPSTCWAPSPVIVELNQLSAVFAYLARIESVPLADITWLKNGEAVKLTPDQIEEWRLTGLNNRDFACQYLLPNSD